MARARKKKAEAGQAPVTEDDAVASEEDLDDEVSDDDEAIAADDAGDDDESYDDEAPDLEEVLAEAPGARGGLAVRREIERRLEERRLAKDMDDLDFDFD